jgi:YHS domain-containing protein
MLRTQRTKTHHLLRMFAMLMIGAMLLVIATPALAAANTGTEKSWGTFLGRLHVVVLHLPIGLIVGAFAIELFGLFRRSKGFDIAAAWLFVLGAISSVVAVYTGLQLGAENAGGGLNAWSILWADDDQVGETLNLHMWLGVGIMLFAIPAAVLKVLSVRRQWPEESSVPHTGGWKLVVARLGLLTTIVLLPSVGHLGGNMTHGQDYLTEHAPSEGIASAINLLNLGTGEEKTVAPPPKDGSVELVNGTPAFWNAYIQPALNNHCTACHDSNKQNGELRLDTLEWAMKGGSIGGTVEPGSAEFSEIYRRVILPPSHEEFMPTNVKKYGMMSQEDIHILGEWLLEFDGKLDSGKAAKPSEKTPEPEPEPVKPIIDPAALKAITTAGGNAQSLSQEEDPDLLTVKFAYLKNLDPAAVTNLKSGADNIAWLTFEGSGFNDEAAKALPDMSKLTKLNLKDSAITDAGLAELPEMPSLIWLNLFGTDVTDTGLDALKQYDTLEKLYLTGTKVSADGVKALRVAMPDTQIFSDHDGQFQFEPVTPEVTPGDPAKDDKATDDKPTTEQAAKPVNNTCPVSGAPVKDGFVSTFQGKTVGFCCNNCKGKFDADPSKFAAKLQ